MWIAKPIHQMTQSELASWLELEPSLPLSQKLCWARAIEVVQGRSFLVFSPDEKVGGLVFSAGETNNPSRPSAPSIFECMNGPFLDWDDSAKAPRQIATFAHAVSRLSPKFQSLTVRPRWSPDEVDRRLGYLPLSPTQVTQASTLVIPIQPNLAQQFNKLSSRLRRTIRIGIQRSVQSSATRVTPSLLTTFVPEMTQFAKTRGFTTPPLDWFVQLTDTPDLNNLNNVDQGRTRSRVFSGNGFPHFWLITSSYSEEGVMQAQCQILVCIEGPLASYLFGYENRAPGLAACISTSAAAQWEALALCRREGVHKYDLNGYVPEGDSDHPYYGVSQFKKQFNGELVNYRAPEFVIG